MSGDWAGALEKYARTNNPAKDIPPSVYLASDEQTVSIFDGYEKAKYHFLIMPRDPFPLSPTTSLPSPSLRTLSALLQAPKPATLAVLRALKAASDQAVAWIEDEMRKTDGFAWPVQVGFHASESMRHCHLHVISSDLVSPKLKNKKHYNSFHPGLGFFLHLEEVIGQVESGEGRVRVGREAEEVLKMPLRSHYTGEEFRNLPKLKDHLEAEFAKRKLAATKKAAAGGARPDSDGKRSTDGDDGSNNKRSKAA